MLRTDRTMIAVAIFLLPVMLCFIGVGAFLHVVVRAEAEEQEAMHSRHEEATQEADELKAAIEQLEQEIEAIGQRLAELEETEARQAELDRLEKLKDRLEKERLAWLQELEELEARSDPKGQECEALRQRREESRRKLEALKQGIAQVKRKIARMAPSPAPGGDPPEEGPSIGELQAAIARIRKELEAYKRKKEQAEAEFAGLAPDRDGPRLEIGAVRGSLEWQAPSDRLYVECDGQGVKLQPDGIRLPARLDPVVEEQFVGLARQRGYVLFLIRPDGFDAFRAYRPLAKKNNIDFGYEPIPQDAWVDY